MSLPSKICFFDEKHNVVASAFINVGWFVSADSLFRAVNESYQTLNNIKANNEYYQKSLNWKEDTNYVQAYGLIMDSSILEQIINNDKRVISTIQKIIENHNNH